MPSGEPIEHFVRAAQRGDERAFSELVVRHYSMVHGLVLGTVGNWSSANDITQEVFLVAWVKMGAIKQPGAFPIWLRQVARTSAVDWLRSEAYRDRLARVLASIPPSVADEADPAQVAARDECLEQIGEDLKSLSPRLREAIALYYLEGNSVSESAHALGIRENTMRKRLQLGCNKLRDKFERRSKGVTLEQLLPYSSRPHADRVMAGLSTAPALAAGRTTPSANAVRLACRHLAEGGSLDALIGSGLAGPAAKAIALCALFCVSAVAASGFAYHAVTGGLGENAWPGGAPPAGQEQQTRMGLFTLQGTPDSLEANSAMVVWVIPGQPAHQAGIRPGDRIVKVNDRPAVAGFERDPSFGVQRPDGFHTRFGIQRIAETGRTEEVSLEVIWRRPNNE